MDVYDVLCELWRKSDYMAALTTAWKIPRPDDYRFFFSQVQQVRHVRDFTLRELIFRACRQAVSISFAGQAERQRAARWVEEFLRDFSPPDVLVNYSDGGEEVYQQAMIRAHLYCVRAALVGQEQPATQSTPEDFAGHEFAEIVQQTGLPIVFFRALFHALLPEEQKSGDFQLSPSAVSLTVFLVEENPGKNLDSGIVATLTLELIPEGSGVLFPEPALAFVRRNPSFREAEQTACRYAQRLGLWKTDHDVCWLLERQDRQPLNPLLKGSSMGFAFALGLAKLLTPS
jgi:hypothetical protein